MNEADPLYSTYIVNCVFNAFSAYAAIVLNILTIHAMRKTSSLPKPLRTLLVSLAVSDLGVGLLAQPSYIAVMVNPTDFTNTALNMIVPLFASASFFSVVAISVDRFLAVHLHLRYQELVTHKRVVVVVISIWVLSAFLASVSFWTSFDIILLVDVIIQSLCYIITGTIYCRIYSTVRRHSDQIHVQQIQVAQNNQMESAAWQRKSAVNTTYVYLVFLVCCLPDHCAQVVRLISPQSSALNGLLFYSLSLFFLNSSLNPVIYCWKMRHIRRAIINTLRNIFLRQN